MGGSRKFEFISPPTLPVLEEDLCYGDICVPYDYNKLEPPFTEGKPLEVKISADGVRAQELDDKKFTISFSMFLSVQWTDNRIISPEASATHPFRVSFEKKLQSHSCFFLDS